MTDYEPKCLQSVKLVMGLCPNRFCTCLRTIYWIKGSVNGNHTWPPMTITMVCIIRKFTLHCSNAPVNYSPNFTLGITICHWLLSKNLITKDKHLDALKWIAIHISIPPCSYLVMGKFLFFHFWWNPVHEKIENWVTSNNTFPPQSGIHCFKILVLMMSTM